MIEKKFKEINTVYFSTERTGTYESVDQFIEISAIKVNYKGEVISRFSEIVKQEKSNDIPKALLNSFGLTYDYINENGSDKKEVIKKFYEFIDNSILIGHGVIKDMSFLVRDIIEILNLVCPFIFIDVKDLVKRMYPNLKNYNLETLMMVYNIEYDSEKYYSPFFRAKKIHNLMEKIFFKLKMNEDVQVKKLIEIINRPMTTEKQSDLLQRLVENSGINMESKFNDSNCIGYCTSMYINAIFNKNREKRIM